MKVFGGFWNFVGSACVSVLIETDVMKKPAGASFQCTVRWFEIDVEKFPKGVRRSDHSFDAKAVRMLSCPAVNPALLSCVTSSAS